MEVKAMQTEVVQYVKEGRYQFYREHKYVSFVLNDLERLVAKTDFRVSSQVEKVECAFNDMVEMLRGHAEYENSKLHPLLQKKGSVIVQEVENDHQHHEAQFQALQNLLNQIKSSSLDDQAKIGMGYAFYLSFRKFVGDNLHHLYEEETKVLPQLQNLYSDAELQAVEAETYQIMTAEELVHMLQVLFPHMNPADRETFLIDIHMAAPEKFPQVWGEIKKIINEQEQTLLLEKFSIRGI